jgi:predicted transcriptional regulator
MSQTLILELSDAVYTTIQRQAEGAGRSPAHWLAETLEQQYGRRHAWQSALKQRTAAARQAARARFEQHFGEVDLSDAKGADNEQIDADLAQEYADTHEAP